MLSTVLTSGDLNRNKTRLLLPGGSRSDQAADCDEVQQVS